MHSTRSPGGQIIQSPVGECSRSSLRTTVGIDGEPDSGASEQREGRKIQARERKETEQIPEDPGIIEGDGKQSLAGPHFMEARFMSSSLPWTQPL